MRSDDNLYRLGVYLVAAVFAVLGTSEGGGTVYLRPNGASNTAGEARVGLNGNFRGQIAAALSITDGQIDAMWTAAAVL